jgi:hypothetical protein
VEPLSEQTFDGARVLRGVLKYHGPVLLAASKDRLALVSGRVDELWARALLKDALWPPAATR